MNDKQKASAVLNYLEEQDSNVVINILQSYIPDENLAALYDKMRQEGIDIGDDDEDDTPEETSDGMADGLAYLREQLEQDEIDEIHAQIDRSYRYHMNPSDCVTNDAKAIDLLEEYGADNDLPEGWWENEGDIDDWLLKL